MDGNGVTMARLQSSDSVRQDLAVILRDTRSLLARTGNNFEWSAWADSGQALEEVDALIAAVDSGQLPSRNAVAHLFAPTGAIQEVSLSSGWRDEFLALAKRYDAVMEKVSGLEGEY